MTDLSALSDEDLWKLYGKPPATQAGPDLSKMSDDELWKLYQPAKKGVVGNSIDQAANMLAFGPFGAAANVAGMVDPDLKTLGSRAISNVPKSAANLAGGLYHAVTNPLETADALGRTMKGALAAANPSWSPARSLGEKEIPLAEQAWEGLKGRYGGYDAIKNTIATDPVGVAADASMFATGVPGAARVASALDPIAQTANAATGTGRAAWAATGPARNLAAANMRNPDLAAANLIARAIERDGMTPQALLSALGDYPAGTPLVVAGGENTRGAMRGSVAAPGPARTTAANAFEPIMEGGAGRVGELINSRVSNLSPVEIRTNVLEAERRAAANPAYEAAGIPRKVESRQAHWDGSEPIPRDASGNLAMWGHKEFNSPIINSPGIDFFLKHSPDVQTAIGAARRLPQFKDLPSNSMVMLDKAYKHLSGMEQEAVRAGNGTRAFDLNNLRQDFQKALTEANPKYQSALDAFSEPSKLIDAANMGRDLFKRSVNQEEVGRLYRGLPVAERQEFLGGVADYLRTRAGNSDRATPGERVANSQNIRERLQAVLPEADYRAFSTELEREGSIAQAERAIFRGSRTTPMALEAAENAGVGVDSIISLMRGRVGPALAGAGRAAYGRVAEGRTSKINNIVAQGLTDQNRFSGLMSALEQSRAPTPLDRAWMNVSPKARPSSMGLLQSGRADDELRRRGLVGLLGQ